MKQKLNSKLGSSINSGNALNNACKKMLNSNNKEDIHKVKKWCLMRSISDQLTRSGKTFLVTDSSSDVAGKWTATYGKRKTDVADKSKLGLKNNWPDTGDNDLEQVKKWCKEKAESYYSKANEEIFKLVEGWCTEQASSVVFKSP